MASPPLTSPSPTSVLSPAVPAPRPPPPPAPLVPCTSPSTCFRINFTLFHLIAITVLVFLLLLIVAVALLRRKLGLGGATSVSSSSGQQQQHRQRQPSHDSWADLENARTETCANTRGVPPEEIHRLGPAFKYRVGSVRIDGGDESSRECTVCLGEYVADENLRRLFTCGHVFHQECIDSWLRSHPSCPLCRTCLLQPSSPQQSQLGQQQAAAGQ